MNCCGIDVSNKTLDVVVRKKEKNLKCLSFNNHYSDHNALIAHLKKHKVTRVGLEATSYYHLDLALAIYHTKGIDVMVINPRASKNFAKAMMQRNKSDASDADMLTEFTARMDFVKWTPPVPEVLDIRACGRRLMSLSKDKTRAKNQLHAYGRTKSTPAFVIEDIQLSITQIDRQMSNLIQHALKTIQHSEVLQERYQLLTSVKGVADKTAIKLLGELGVLAIDMSAKQWVAHAALYPRLFESGTSVKKRTCIGKAGNRYIREALYMAALSATNHDPHIRGFYLHMIEDNGLSKLQAICAVMRKLLLAMHGMLKQNKSFNGTQFYNLETTAID